MNSASRLISTAWILTGVLLAIWCAREMYQSYQYFHFISGAFKSSLMGVAYAMLAMTAGVGISLGKVWGRFLLNVVSILALLYALMFVLFHGYMDRSLGYASCVVALSIVAIASLIAVNGKRPGTR